MQSSPLTPVLVCPLLGRHPPQFPKTLCEKRSHLSVLAGTRWEKSGLWIEDELADREAPHSHPVCGQGARLVRADGRRGPAERARAQRNNVELARRETYLAITNTHE